MCEIVLPSKAVVKPKVSIFGASKMHFGKRVAASGLLEIDHQKDYSAAFVAKIATTAIFGSKSGGRPCLSCK